MKLYERYIGTEILDLIRILEDSSNYTEKCIEIIWEVIKDRSIDFNNYQDDILFVNRELIKKRLNTLNLLEDKIQFHQSNFLSEQEVKNLYKIELEKFIKKQEHFGFDVWSYAVGGL